MIPPRLRRSLLWCLAVHVFLAGTVTAQVLTGALVGTVKDELGGALPGASIRVTSPALIGGSRTVITNEKGQFRFPVLQPGTYAIDIELKDFAPYHEEGLSIGAGNTLASITQTFSAPWTLRSGSTTPAAGSVLITLPPWRWPL